VSQAEATLLIKIKEMGQEVLDKFVITLGDVIGIAKSVASAIYATVEAFREEQTAINELSNSMMQAGTFTGALREKYIQMASALQDLTTYGDEQIISAQAILQAHIGNKEVTEDLVKATLDLAAAKKMDLSSAADLVGKAIAGETSILERHRIYVKDATDENEKMGNVIDAISGKFGGRAAAMTKDLGIIDQLKNTWSDFLEKIGALVAPTVQGLAAITNATLKLFNAMMPTQFDATKSSIDGINQKILELRRNIIKMQDGAEMRGTGLDAMEKAMIAKWEKEIAVAKAAQEQMIKDEQTAADKSVEINANKNIQKNEERIAQQIRNQDMELVELEMFMMSEEQKLAAKIAALDKEIAAEDDFKIKQQMVTDRAALIQQQKLAIAKSQQLKLEQMHQQAVIGVISAGANLATAIGDSGSKEVFLIQKAAAIASAIIATNLAVAQAMAAPPGPPYNAGIVAMTKATGYMNVAAIAATAIKGLATGGIVSAKPGGTPFIIGEGGKDEAVIPLEDGKIPGSGGVTININGNMVGDERSLYALAKMLDPMFLKMRQNNESVAFDTGVI
jgi:hypothetical protein